MLTLLDEDEVGTSCKDEKHDAEHENIAAGVRWYDIKGRSRRRRGTNTRPCMFSHSMGYMYDASSAGRGLATRVHVVAGRGSHSSFVFHCILFHSSDVRDSFVRGSLRSPLSPCLSGEARWSSLRGINQLIT